MPQNAQNAPAVVPYFGYMDVAAALEWLAEAFGFEKTQEVSGPDGNVMHAEMQFKGGVIMLGQEAGDGPGEWGGLGVYLVVEDVDAHYERAKAAGADIVYPPGDTDFGTRRYRARDLGGYGWSFGSYQPQPGGS